jgi:hypothetical protein
MICTIKAAKRMYSTIFITGLARRNSTASPNFLPSASASKRILVARCDIKKASEMPRQQP